jgi:hypothetical protein
MRYNVPTFTPLKRATTKATVGCTFSVKTYKYKIMFTKTMVVHKRVTAAKRSLTYVIKTLPRLWWLDDLTKLLGSGSTLRDRGMRDRSMRSLDFEAYNSEESADCTSTPSAVQCRTKILSEQACSFLANQQSGGVGVGAQVVLGYQRLSGMHERLWQAVHTGQILKSTHLRF